MANLRGRTEKDTCSEYVLPALTTSGWTEVMIRPEYAVKHGRVTSVGGIARTIGDGRVDYVLEAVPGVPTAAVEAKREYSTPSQGLQQAIRYAQQLDAPLAYSTNGHGFVERNLLTGSERTLQSLPTPAEVWSVYAQWHGLDADGQELLAEPFNRNRLDVAGNVIEPRWYQTMAVHRVLRAMSAGQRRVLLLMATGTGKTLTAMQIVAKSRTYEQAKHPERNYRVLYLADLDVLLRQPMEKDFKNAFGGEPLHRVLGGRNTSREIYFSSYQALTGQGADTDKLFSDYDPDFFDLVIVDECHRGSAKADGQWRQVLDHFSSAVQIGLTATPKRTKEIDSYDYFGDPVFEYSLRQGIDFRPGPHRQHGRSGRSDRTPCGPCNQSSDVSSTGSAKRDLPIARVTRWITDTTRPHLPTRLGPDHCGRVWWRCATFRRRPRHGRGTSDLHPPQRTELGR